MKSRSVFNDCIDVNIVGYFEDSVDSIYTNSWAFIPYEYYKEIHSYETGNSCICSFAVKFDHKLTIKDTEALRLVDNSFISRVTKVSDLLENFNQIFYFINNMIILFSLIMMFSSFIIINNYHFKNQKIYFIQKVYNRSYIYTIFKSIIKKVLVDLLFSFILFIFIFIVELICYFSLSSLISISVNFLYFIVCYLILSSIIYMIYQIYFLIFRKTIRF